MLLPETASGRKQRDTVRFALWGEAGDAPDPLVEHVSTGRVRDHANELVGLATAPWGAFQAWAVRLARWERPGRSCVALVAWWSTCSRAPRGVRESGPLVGLRPVRPESASGVVFRRPHVRRGAPTAQKA